ncbi:MAG: PspC family transcriptional regulator [Flavobacteriales bacterium]|jgi:phage shock protein C|nr:PspC family transcriptional regulator [Flavobacteriales bacterium]
MIQRILDYFERQAFGVCSWWGSKLGIAASKVRLSFIYLSFLTLGSPIIIYLVMVFVLENKAYFKLNGKRKTIWDL